MDSLRYWVTECHVDGFRFDLASRAGARILRRRPAVGVLRRDPPGPGPLPGQADRRAVGRRPGRLPGRQLPGAVVGVERHLPRHDARLLARARERRASSPRRLSGSSDLYEADGREPFASINFITAHDGFTLPTSSPTTTSTTRPTSRTTATAPTTTARGTAAPRAETDDPAILALRAPPAAQLPDHAAALPGHADAARRRRARPHPGRQQQRLVPGQRDLLVRLGADEPGAGRAARVHAPADRAAPRASRVPARELPRGQASRATGAAGRVVVPPRRAQDDPPRLAGRRAGARHVPQRRGDPDPRPARRGRSSTTRSCCCSTRTSEDRTFTLPASAFGDRVGARAVDRRPDAPKPEARSYRGARPRSRDRPLARSCCKRAA